MNINIIKVNQSKQESHNKIKYPATIFFLNWLLIFFFSGFSFFSYLGAVVMWLSMNGES